MIALIVPFCVLRMVLARLGDTYGVLDSSGRPNVAMVVLTVVVCGLRWALLLGVPSRLGHAVAYLATGRR